MVDVVPRTDPVAPAPMAHEASSRPRLRAQVVSALLLAVAALGDVLVSWHVPGRLTSCPPEVAILDCSEALTVTVVPGLAAAGAVLVWFVGTVVGRRRGGVVWCWAGAVVAFAPWVFAVPGLAVR
jgi:hypothetical protein